MFDWILHVTIAVGDGQLYAWLHQPLQKAVQRALARGWDWV